jgi:Icc-related predicted phosphoesterase
LKTRFIGDVHGNKYELGLVLDNLPQDVTSVIQVGDMGVGFGQGDFWHESLEYALEQVNGRFIRGNHDNPAMCKTMKSWIQDGIIEDDVMFVGGAWSIDRQWRTKDYDWWEDEELSYSGLNTLIGVYDYARPRVMVTHDCPLSVSEELFIKRGKSFSGTQYRTRTGAAFQEMFEMHKPKLWIFGHWHCDVDEVIDSTRFICLNELSYADIDLKTLDVDFPSYQLKRGKP